MPQSLLDGKKPIIDLATVEKQYLAALEEFFEHHKEKALYDVSNLGKQLVLARHGPDILLEVHAKALVQLVEKKDPPTISRIVVNANEVLLSGIMAYAMNYYSYLDILDNERAKLHEVKDQLEAQTNTLEAANQRLLEVDRDREQMLMQQSRFAAMGEMLVNISHQWRQPLNVLGLILQDLSRSYERSTLTKESLDNTTTRARQLIAHMSGTIDDFRNYLNPQKLIMRFDVEEVVRKAAAMVGEGLKGIELQVHPMSEEPIIIEGYRNEYTQAVMNILLNARDAFLEKGVASPRITITISREGERSIVTIADNAGGIADGVISRIFEPYFTTKAPEGTGIGLFMCKTIIEKSMSGSLTVRNTDVGAEFRIEV